MDLEGRDVREVDFLKNEVKRLTIDLEQFRSITLDYLFLASSLLHCEGSVLAFLANSLTHCEDGVLGFLTTYMTEFVKEQKLPSRILISDFYQKYLDFCAIFSKFCFVPIDILNFSKRVKRITPVRTVRCEGKKYYEIKQFTKHMSDISNYLCKKYVKEIENYCNRIVE